MRPNATWLDRMVAFVAPRSTAGLIAKSLVFCVAGLAFYVTQQALTQGPPPSGWAQAISDVVIVGAPFIFMLMALIGRMARMQDDLHLLATTDMLTGLPNRRDFFERGSRLARPGTMVLMLDIDHFKRLNDRHGHEAGDRCLVALAGRLARLEEEGHLVGRLGGEEFAIALTGTDSDGARRLGETLATPLAVPLESQGAPTSAAGPEDPFVEITVSVGVCCVGEADDLDAVLRRADSALYLAKARGRARVCVWSSPDGPEPADEGLGGSPSVRFRQSPRPPDDGQGKVA